MAGSGSGAITGDVYGAATLQLPPGKSSGLHWSPVAHAASWASAVVSSPAVTATAADDAPADALSYHSCRSWVTLSPAHGWKARR